MAYDFEFEVAVGETKTFDLSSKSYGVSINNISYVGAARTYVTCVKNASDDSKLDVTGNAEGVAVVDVSAGRLALSIQITVTAASVEDQNFLNERGLTHFWENIDEIKQDKLTAGAGISITGNTISATGGGTADAVDWGHITGTMSDQTDLTTALAAKANSADLATVATSGLYSDLNSRPVIGNALITIQKNGVSAGAFTTNATSSKTINITVPTDADDVGALPDTTKYGASISVSVNTTDYKVTTTLKDQDGNTLGTAQVIDLPLESVVVNGSYDSTNKKIVLTLQNGNTIDIPVADLIAGLQSEITSTNKLASDLVDDTNQTHKFMTSAEKTKLAGIAAGAEVNVQANWTQTTTTADDYIKNKPTLATVATSGSYNDLSNKPTIPAAQVNSDWDAASGVAQILNKPTLATVATSGSYNDLSNKPTIPTVNNATLTIQKNGANVQTFTANSSSNKTANITVPTQTSDLTNDSGFVTAEDIASTSDVTPVITTAMIADEAVTTAKIVDGAITDEKIDWTSFGSAEWPIINTNTSNNNVNTNQFYTQYEYTVPVDGVYMVMFSQRLTNGANSYDFTIRITYNNVQVQAVAAGGSSWVNWIPGTVFAFIEAEAGGIIRCQSSGGGTGVYVPQNGRVSIMRIR